MGWTAEHKRQKDREYQAKWYLKNKTKHQQKVKNNKIRVRKINAAKIAELKKAPCLDCGGIFNPECMDYAHLDATEKVYSIAHMVQSFSWITIQKEIDKCELICSNCHRTRTKNRRIAHQVRAQV